MAREKICGIYKITNQIDGKVYIGQSEDIYKRWQEHKLTSIKNNSKEYEYPLYQAFREDGLENFVFDIIDECPKKDLNFKEEYYISLYESFPPSKGKGYNQTPGGCSKTPYIHGKTESHLLQIVKDLKNPQLNYEDIALKYGMSSDTIRNINKGIYIKVEGEIYPIRKVNSPNKIKKNLFCICCGVKINFDSKTKLCRKCFDNKQAKEIPPKKDLLKDLYELRKDYLVAEKYRISTTLLKDWKIKLGIPRKRYLVDKMYEEEYLHIVREDKPKRKINFPIWQLDKETGKIIQYFESISVAAKYIQLNFLPNTSLQNISQCIDKGVNNEVSSACGYKWRRVQN